MKRYALLAVPSLLVVLAALAGAAEGPRWELLGRQEVNFQRDRDRINVGRRDGRFKQLQIRVSGASIEIRKMVVTFGNDETFRPDLKHRFDEKSKSRVIDLPGERRTIKSIDFDYHSPNRREGKATVAVYGR
ncbi:MAG: hypothetical protein ACREQ7_24500 [Candidatus Binatia bacterium]